MFKELWQFAKECVKWANAGSWKWKGWLTLGIGLTLAVLSLFFTGLYNTWFPAATKEWVFLGLAVLGFSYFLLRLAFAPFNLWRAMRREVITLKQEVETLRNPVNAEPPIAAILNDIEEAMVYAQRTLERERDFIDAFEERTRGDWAMLRVKCMEAKGIDDPIPAECIETFEAARLPLNWPELLSVSHAIKDYLQKVKIYNTDLDSGSNEWAQKAQHAVYREIRKVRSKHKFSTP